MISENLLFHSSDQQSEAVRKLFTHSLCWQCHRGCGLEVCECVCTQVVAAALGDAVAVHLAEVSGAEVDAGRMQQHAAQTSQSALWWNIKVTRCVALQTDTQGAETALI